MRRIHSTSEFWANFCKLFIEFVCDSLRGRYFITIFNKIRREVRFRFTGIYYVFQGVPGISYVIFISSKLVDVVFPFCKPGTSLEIPVVSF